MEITPTRSALLTMKDEQHLMGEGFRFLDEKRMLLAGELMRRLKEYEQRMVPFRTRFQEAVVALGDALEAAGLTGAQTAPIHDPNTWRLTVTTQNFFGVSLQQAVLSATGTLSDLTGPAPAMPAPELDQCRTQFVELLMLAGDLAALEGNLHRLHAEYQRSERRARALENVLLPELDTAIHEMDIRLEEMEQEEAVRVRLSNPGT
jgi:V/A-type H+-transporting ATPase subunit D